jgi:hypothetical protein
VKRLVATSLAAVALSVAAVGLVVSVSASSDPTHDPDPNLAAAAYQAPIRSGLPWPSGVYVPGWSDTNYNAFGTWRDKPVDVAVAWPARTTWEDFTSSNALYTALRDKPFTAVLGIPPIPEGAGATMPNCANGSYNSRWTTFGTTLKDLGLGASIIRLGWEFNGNWYAWGGTNNGSSPATFAACYKQIVTTVRAVAPGLKFDWNVNRGPSSGFGSEADVLAAYPGDDYVDIIGVDSYSHWGDWNTQLSANQGLQYWLDFAVKHGKKLSVPEWGMLPHSDGNGGDHPADVQHMWDFFNANAANIAYEGYFNDWDTFDSNVYPTSGANASVVPQSAAKYLSLYKSASSITPSPAPSGSPTTGPGPSPSPTGTSAPSPTGTTSPPPAGTSTVDDTATGVKYSSGWNKCTDNCSRSSDGSFQWTSAVNSSLQFQFTGTTFTLYGMKEPWGYIGSVSIDGGPAIDIDFYAASVSTTTVPVYTSAALAKGSHTVKLTMTNRKNAASSGGQSITFDRAVITA